MRLRELLGRLFDRLRRDQLAAELDEELRHHRALLERDADSSRSLGNVTYYREETRAMWSLGIVDDLIHDVRYAARVLRRDIGFTAAVVVTLALGIGANTAVFGIVNAVLLRELPYADPDRLVSVWTSQTGTPSDRNPASLPDLRDWQRQQTVFSGVAGYAFNRFDISDADGETQARAAMGTGTLYEVLGARPLIGRLPRRDEEMAAVVAISHRLWQDRFAGAKDVVGRTMRMNGTNYTVVGVMPPGFHFPSPDIDLWMTMHPIASMPAANGPNPWLTSRTLHGYRVVARLAPNVSMDQAADAMNDIQRRLGEAYPEEDAGTAIHLQSVRTDDIGTVQRGLWTVFGAAGLILLLACVNVAHLLLARLSARGRELAVRRALGAHRGRVVRQLITESVLLGVLGGTAGILAAYGLMRPLLRFVPKDIPHLENVAIDATTLAFAIALSLATGLAFGVLPALFGWSGDMHETLRAQGKGAATGGAGARSTLAALEVAFAVVLLVGAGLMIRSFAQLTGTPVGVDPAGVTVTQVTLAGQRYQSNEAKAVAMESILSSLRALPGVTAVGASTSMPPSRIQESRGFEIVGKPAAATGRQPSAIYIPATSGFIEALGIRLVRGRAFDVRDDAKGQPVMLISAELARRHFSDVNPVGHEIVMNGQRRTIVGVVGDAVYQGVGTPPGPVIYVPFAQSPFAGVWIALRSSMDTRAMTEPVRAAVHRVDPQLAARRTASLESMIGESVVRPRFHTWLLSSFGGLALVLAAIGIYGVIAYGVAQRRPEIGIRIALGAPRSAVMSMIVRAGMAPVAIGIAGGLVAAAAGSRLVAGLLYGITPTDGFTYAAVALVFAAAGLAAAYVPAVRASRVDPLTAIRAD